MPTAERLDPSKDCPLAGALADRLRAARDGLTTRWLERIAARVSIGRDRVFPGEELLDHIPVLIDGIADYVENPAEEVAADAPVVAKAMELGELRYVQCFDAYQLFKDRVVWFGRFAAGTRVEAVALGMRTRLKTSAGVGLKLLLGQNLGLRVDLEGTYLFGAPGVGDELTLWVGPIGRW